MEGRFVQDQIEKRSGVCLYDEEEDFLSWNIKQGRANDGVWRVSPNFVSNQI
jgi:hypothetical protein